jgi:3-oxoacyl-[acyl-carrier protein] reductase
VRAASADLATAGHLVNAVLPSVTDTPMTRAMLSDEQVQRVAAATGLGRLTSLDDVAEAVAWLCSPANTGVTGQSIPVDLGFSHVRHL